MALPEKEGVAYQCERKGDSHSRAGAVNLV
ncbi:hypothetical protein CCACVL1_18630 [Corchorus capsularis]|uniref:Uncharacterized protein n=1 Tax=Corchorus capsularis TaxID=210143 RepID=A0A1R3HKJ3_COCAP|nr:hypothetical protein CCACVL1_18630 [Corchorus capsularis]